MGFTFKEAFQQATNARLPFAVRWSYAKRCIWKHAQCTGQLFSTTFERIGHASHIPLSIIYAFPVHNTVTEDHLHHLLAITSQERARYLVKYNAYRIQREKEKRIGKLQPPKAYRIFLAKPDYYDSLCIPLMPYQPDSSSCTYGYLDATGEICIKPQFDQAGPFIENTAYVKIKSQHYIISSTGEILRTL
jgi:hypothetical protein